MLKSTGGCGYNGANIQAPDQGPQNETLSPHVQARPVELWTSPLPLPLPAVLISVHPPIDLPRHLSLNPVNNLASSLDHFSVFLSFFMTPD